MLDLGNISGLRTTRTLAAGAVFALLAGCHDGGGEGGTSTGGTAGTTGPTTQAEACSKDPRAEAYKVGMQGKSKDLAITITFEDADPSPPAKGDNTWIIKITDAAGKPVNNATIEAKAYMPDHGHESTSKPKVTPMGSDGRYEIKPINLFMPGIWEVTLDVTPPNGKPEPVKFTFCVAG